MIEGINWKDVGWIVWLKSDPPLKAKVLLLANKFWFGFVESDRSPISIKELYI